jgi:hypothetical protein
MYEDNDNESKKPGDAKSRDCRKLRAADAYNPCRSNNINTAEESHEAEKGQGVPPGILALLSTEQLGALLAITADDDLDKQARQQGIQKED